jgi:hypothetical protein
MYTAKSLVDGYKMGIEYSGKAFIAVPLNKAIPGKRLAYKNKMMTIKGDPVCTRSFPDKFGRGTYSLCYYEWKPETLW